MITNAPAAVRAAALAVTIPSLGLGTWELHGEACRFAVATALELGYRHIDTAQGYANEAEVGRAIAESSLPRAQLFITTKVWPDHLVADPSVIDASLERLQLGEIDLVLLHWPSPTLAIETIVEALAALQSSGKAGAVGVSNFLPGQLERALAVCPALACNQVELHPYLQQAELRRACAAAGIAVVGYCPLARGLVLDDPTIARCAARHGKSPAQLVLRWLLELGVVAIPKASSLAHLRENIELFDFELAAEDRQALAALDRGQRLINPDFAPDWAL